MKKIIFEGKAKVGKTWSGTWIQKHKFKDKFGTCHVGESRSCYIDTVWGQLHLPDYEAMNNFGNKRIRIVVEAVKKK